MQPNNGCGGEYYIDNNKCSMGIQFSLNFLAGTDPTEESEVVESAGTMNGDWSSLATNKDSPIEFYFASDARFVLLSIYPLYLTH